MQPDICTCVDVLLSEEELRSAMALAQAHNPANRPSPFELGGFRPWLWKRGDTLRVSFLGGDESLHDRVRRHAAGWCDYANIHFNFLPYTPGQYPQAEIRVAFVPDGRSWSYIGTQSLKFTDPRQPTMNLGWLATADETEARRVVLHEFGHALGCIHEHMHPQQGIPWDREAVYAYYAKFGWTQHDVEVNLFARYTEDSINGSSYDPNSIMHYQIVAPLRLDRKETPWNTELSAQDKAHIATLYPAEG